MNVREWMTKTTAGEIMVREVTTLKQTDTLADAAALLLRTQVTGVPVLDERGACVGVLSASDVLRAEEKVATERRKVAESSFWHSNLALPVSVYEAKLAEVGDKIAPAAEQPVYRFMTTDVVSVRADTPLHTVIRYLVDAHIHRLLVLDDAQRLQGLISTTDVLAALLRT